MWKEIYRWGPTTSQRVWIWLQTWIKLLKNLQVSRAWLNSSERIWVQVLRSILKSMKTRFLDLSRGNQRWRLRCKKWSGMRVRWWGKMIGWVGKMWRRRNQRRRHFWSYSSFERKVSLKFNKKMKKLSLGRNEIKS